MTDSPEPGDHLPPSDITNYPFEFRGDGFEFFKIWIVNLLLTILTLGIYSAWAKVRTKRYFYSNLYVAGSPFQYLAQPMQILIGRLIAVGVFLLYSVTLNFAPTVGMIIAFLLFFAIPFLVMRSLAFNARMSAWRNVQFRFHGGYGDAFMVLYVWPLLGMLSFGLLYPYAVLRMNEYIVDNSSYGTTSFAFDAGYLDYGKIFLVAILGFGLTGALLAVLGAGADQGEPNPVLLIIPVIGYGVTIVLIRMMMINLYYNSSSLDRHELDAELEFPGYFMTCATVFFLTIVTLGLYLPAAKVRLTHYVADHMTFIAVGSIDDFVQAEREAVSALGEEFGEVFDFDIGSLA